MEVPRVREIADGRILSGQQAMELGLVDRMGNFQDAIDLAAEMGGIHGKPHVIYPRKRRNITDLLFGKVIETLVEKIRVSNHELFYRSSPARCL